MRLVCPNCEAKYEVPEDAIPDVGRDVQCASCNHSWFQMRPRVGAPVIPAAAEMPAPAVAEPVRPDVSDPEKPDAISPDAVVPETALPDAAEADLAAALEVAIATDPEVAAPQDAPAADLPGVDKDAQQPGLTGKLSAEADQDTEIDPDAGGSEATGEASDAKAAAAYAVDESVLAILREEAEREVQARRAEALALETQTDLGLDAAMPGRAKAAPPSAGAAAMTTEVTLKPGLRRDLLPDVEEINSTLRPTEMPVDDFIQSAPPAAEANGFRSGFLVVMTVAIIGTAVYTAAPSLSVMVPALAGPLETFVGAVDSLRLSLDGVMQSATVAINGG